MVGEHGVACTNSAYGKVVGRCEHLNEPSEIP
jgi:hypothetical protein